MSKSLSYDIVILTTAVTRPKLHSSVFKNINKIVTYFNDWKPGKQALMGGAPDKFYNTVKVENKFNVKI